MVASDSRGRKGERTLVVELTVASIFVVVWRGGRVESGSWRFTDLAAVCDGMVSVAMSLTSWREAGRR